jgi:hypothetical protein
MIIYDVRMGTKGRKSVVLKEIELAKDRNKKLTDRGYYKRLQH